VRVAARLAALALLSAVAAAPPAASLSRAYICFFDTGSAELSPRCRDIILEFAARWHRTVRGEEHAWPDGAPVPAHAMQVEVEGHADAAGAAAGKGAVGRARAEGGAAFLRLNGVPADSIEVTAFGAERLVVPVPWAEPQNRRAQLVAR
jgi:outer membrane protein OmpA-like peptidoglycan-associated protein